MVLRSIRIAEFRVRFPISPPDTFRLTEKLKKLPRMGALKNISTKIVSGTAGLKRELAFPQNTQEQLVPERMS